MIYSRQLRPALLHGSELCKGVHCCWWEWCLDLFDAGYFRLMLIVASIGLVFGLMMLSLATQFYQVLLAQGVLCGISSGLLYTPSISLGPVYFKRHRGLALGLAIGGGSIGGIVYPLVFRRLLSELGFGDAVRIMGVIAFCSLFTATVLSRQSRERSDDNCSMLELCVRRTASSTFARHLVSQIQTW